MSKLRNKLIVVLAVLLCAMLCISTAFLIPEKSANAAYSVAHFNIIGSDSDDLYLGKTINGKVINGNFLDKLYKEITGKKGATLEDVSRLVSNGNFTSADIRSNSTDGKNISIWFGELKWDAVFMTTVRSDTNAVDSTGSSIVGDVVLDLLLSADMVLEDTAHLVQFSPHGSQVSGNVQYPDSMYGRSKIRVETLNAGGQYSQTNTTLHEEISPSNTNRYARFTMKEGTDSKSVRNSLVQFIVKPKDIEYQESLSSRAAHAYDPNPNQPIYQFPNDAYGEIDNSLWCGLYNNMPLFHTKNGYDLWKEDYIWLPAISEMGSYAGCGLWATNEDLRSTINKNTWVRSSSPFSGDRADGLQPNGNTNRFNANSYLGVRPAFHFNLSKAEENAIRLLSVGEVSNPYNGKAQTLDDLTEKPAWYNEDLITDSSKVRVECPANMIDVGEYTVKVTLLDTVNYYWSDGNTSSATRTFKYKITKAPLNIQTLRVDENGNLQGDGSVNDIITNTYLSTTLYERDVGKSSAPRFGVQYKRTIGGSWSTALPSVAGEYYVRAYIINDDNLCNYYLASDGQATFKKPKEYVETPHFTQEGLEANQIVGSTTTVQYSGDYQEFKLVNTPDDRLVGVNIGERTGGLSFDQKTGTFRAKAVGIYTVEALLEDGGANTQWDNDSVETSRIITLIITRAELRVNIPDGDMTSWTKGDIDYITVEVTGVRNSENVKLDVYYMVTGSSAKTYVADSAMNLNDKGDTIIVTVNLATFDTNKEYQLFVALREDIAVNDNYTIINNSEPYKFFIMTATINDNEVVGTWTISNVITGTKEATNGIEVDYNGSSYTLLLDESKLPKGLEFNYTNESFTDVRDGGYTTKVMITCESGYQLASGKSSISFEISWKINPIEYDVVDLVWADNPEWNDTTLTMGIINLPSWLAGNVDDTWNGNSARRVGNYTAICVLMSDGNYTFTYSGNDEENNSIDYGGSQATLKHEWQITKKIINVTNAPKQWTTETVSYSAGDTYYYYNIYVPAGIDLSLVKITYWEDANFTTKVENIRQITVDYSESKTYYIKIEIADDWESTCELYNTLTKGNFAYSSFRVGGNMEIIEVTYESPDEFMYDGQPHGITAKYRNLQLTYTYFKLEDGAQDSSLGDVAPTEVGNYKVVVTIDGQDAEYYWIQNSVFYFSIKPLVLTTNGYAPATGNQLKKSIVISDADVNTSDYFEYQIFNKNNQRVYEPLEFNTTYTVRLVILNEHKEHAVWADDAVTTYIFTTSYDPSAGTQYFDDPTITVKDKDGTTVDTDSVVWTSDDYTVTINDWDKIAAFVTVTVNGQEDNNGSYNFSDVGVYTITITIKEEVLSAEAAAWLWDNGSGSKTLTFEIIKRYVGIPTANGEVGYNGEEQYLFPDGYEEDYINLSDGAIISATEIGGEWVVTLSLKDKVNSCWADGTTEDKTFTWSIVEATDDPNGDDEGDLAKKKEDAKKDLEDVAQKKKDEIDSDPDMTDEEKEEAKKKVDEELQKGKDAIDSATSSSGVDSAFKESKKNIEDIGLKNDSGSFPWWIIALIAGVLAILAVLIIVIVKRRQAADGDDDYYDDFYDDDYDFDEEYEEDDVGDDDF